MAGVFDSLMSDDPKEQAYMALAAGLLSGRGNFNKVAGEALMGSQNVYRQAQQAQEQRQQHEMQRQLWQAQMKKYEHDATKPWADATSPASVREFQFYNALPPEQQLVYNRLKRAQQIQVFNGVPHQFINGKWEPMTNLDTEAAARETLSAAAQRGSESVKANYDLVPGAVSGYGPDAQKVPVTRAQVLGMTRGAPASSADTSTQVPPNIQAARDVDRMKILEDELAKATDPFDRAALQREISRTKMAAIPAAQQGAVRLGVTPREEAVAKGSAAAQDDFVKSTRTSYDALKYAPAVIQNIEAAKKLVPSASSFMGPGGEGLLVAAKFLNNRLGTDIKLEGVKGAEEMRTRLFMQIMENLKKMDAQPSQLQQQMMMASLGNLGTDPQALPRVLDVMADAVRTKVSIHNKEVEDAIKNGLVFPYDPIVKLDGGSSADGLPSAAAIEAEIARRAAAKGGRK
jgi:hypothetical protein